MAEQEAPKVGDVFFVKGRNGMHRRTVGRVTPAGKIEFAEHLGFLWKRHRFGQWEQVGGAGWSSAYAMQATPELEAEYDAQCSRNRLATLAEAVLRAVRAPGVGRVSDEAAAKMESVLAELAGKNGE